MSTGRSNLGGAGTQTTALAYGGAPTISSSEEWNDYSGTNQLLV